MLIVGAEETQKITTVVKRKYKNVSQSLEGQFSYPTGKVGLQQLGYPEELVESVPDDVVAWYCGVGNPFSLTDIMPGEHVLDVGCGAGVDTLFAAKLTEPTGYAAGVDFSKEMIERAEHNKQLAEVGNVSFQVADAAALPFEDASFDVVTTNAMLNLAVDKRRTLREIYRVLKDGGRFHIADQMLVGAAQEKEQAISDWFK